MKFIKFFTVLLGTVALFSCSENETEQLYIEEGEQVSVPLTVEAPDAITQRSGVAGTDSQYGGIANIDFDQYDIRYIIEIYNEAGDKLAKNRIVRIYDDASQSFTEEVQLTRDRRYKFVAWADFVAEGSTPETVVDLHYNTQKLAEVKVIVDNYKINDESRDAFAGCVTHQATPGVPLVMSLQRPFGKVRVVTTDADALSFGQTISKVRVVYESDVVIPAGYNCFTGAPLADKLTLGALTAVPYGYTADTEAMKTVFTDYIIANATTPGVVKFTLTAIDANDVDIATYEFVTDAPVKVNGRTTYIGGVFTTSTPVSVSVTTDFDAAASKDIDI